MNKQIEKIKELESQINKLKAAVSELKVLNEIAVESGKAVDIDNMLNLILKKTVSAINAEQGSILLTTKNKEKPLITFVRQDDTSSLRHNYHIGTNITGWVLLYKKPLIIEDLSNDKRFRPSKEEIKDIHTVLCVPMWFKGGIIGVMMLINKKNAKCFSEDDLTLFSIISVQASQLIKNLELQRETFQRIKESEKLEELDKAKSKFFTNVTHEFRTPINLILGPAKQILKESQGEKIKEEAEIIIRSANRLNRLSGQLLDLSSIDTGNMKLKLVKRDLISIIRNSISSFRELADRKKISLRFNSDRKELLIWLDEDKMEKIISNLLSNAVKFTPVSGSVGVNVVIKSELSGQPESATLNTDYVEISVSDTGIGISQDYITNIFDRFYQIDNSLSNEYEGYGIGLSLTKELVEIHKGKIIVESLEGKGSTFRVFIPMNMEYLSNKNAGERKSTDKVTCAEIMHINLNEGADPLASQKSFKNERNLYSNYIENKPTVLIVEDNNEFRTYLNDILKSFYIIKQASNGEEALSISFEQIPDLVVTDIKMPKMDGIEFCSALKTDWRTSHIPVILLTAKSRLKDKVEGLEIGADAYITKPFEDEELISRIKNLLNQRKRVHEHFHKHGLFELEETNVTSFDHLFLSKAIDIINQHIPDSDFSVEYLAKYLAMSRSLLHKKLIALIGKTPGDLIRKIRLDRALILIEQKAASITEIAYEVGFNNPSYFSECFRNQFGCNPSDYHKYSSPK